MESGAATRANSQAAELTGEQVVQRVIAGETAMFEILSAATISASIALRAPFCATIARPRT